jgi:hypothetical protein
MLADLLFAETPAKMYSTTSPASYSDRLPPAIGTPL